MTNAVEYLRSTLMTHFGWKTIKFHFENVAKRGSNVYAVRVNTCYNSSFSWLLSRRLHRFTGTKRYVLLINNDYENNNTNNKNASYYHLTDFNIVLLSRQLDPNTRREPRAQVCWNEDSITIILIRFFLKTLELAAVQRKNYKKNLVCG